jgi:hypothetical protein
MKNVKFRAHRLQLKGKQLYGRLASDMWAILYFSWLFFIIFHNCTEVQTVPIIFSFYWHDLSFCFWSLGFNKIW